MTDFHHNLKSQEEQEEGHEEPCEMIPNCMTTGDHPSGGAQLSSSLSESDPVHTYQDSTWMLKKPEMSVSKEDWGIPGFLSQDEFHVFVRFYIYSKPCPFFPFILCLLKYR